MYSGKIERKVLTFTWTAFLFLSHIPSAFSQNLCTGNLGDNIFYDGDFDSGTANIVQNDPLLAPGFQYTTQMPPDDGEYTLTNDMSKWSGIYPTWLEIGDNSPDPNGYMMVVNASFTPGIFYEKTIISLCENTLYEFSADVINVIRRQTAGHILPNVSFLLDGVELYTTGDIPQDEVWHTYGFTFTTVTGQHSMKLSLRNNAPGGIGNDLAIDNISFRACGPDATISIVPDGKICESEELPVLFAHLHGESGAVQWQMSDPGNGWIDIANETDTIYEMGALPVGIYHFRYLFSTTVSNLSNPNCRIVSDIIMVEVVPVEFNITETLCEGLTYDLGGIEYGETGVYQQHFIASNGCDSIVTLDLVIFPDPPIVAEFLSTPTSCEGANDGSISILSVSGARPPFIFYINDSLIPPPNTYVELPAGTYTVTIKNEFGCFDAEEIVIPDGPALDIHTIGDVTIQLGHSILLETTSNLPVWSTQWQPIDGLSCANCLSPLAAPFFDQTYVVSAQTAEGCTDEDSVTVRVNREPLIFIPNVFTPNGDQINDFFEVFADPLTVTAILKVMIFDRWGGIIDEKTDLFNEGQIELWDGLTPYGPANPGTYVYLIEFKLADETTLAYSGDVTVLR